jgi:hypothetical protein
MRSFIHNGGAMTGPLEAVIKKTLPPDKIYSAARITLYGVRLESFESYVGPEMKKVNVNFWIQGADQVLALVFGYAYQGHCYDLPEPTAMLLPGKTQQPAKGCCYDDGNLGYQMWQVEKHEMTVQFQVTNDSFEEVILRRNLAGTKPPLAYHSAAALSHRGGKLME